MKIHEYQGKDLLKKYGITIPRGIPVFSVEEAVSAAKNLGGSVWVIKAQIHAGGRGKGGGVKLANSIDEVREISSKILGMQLVTHQTSPTGQEVRCLLIEEGISFQKEYYISVITDRNMQRICFLASSEGGMDIEEITAHDPNQILKVFINPEVGIEVKEIEKLVEGIGIPETSKTQAVQEFIKIYEAYWNTDADLLEINPLILSKSGKIISLDAKISFDDNSLFRHPEIVAYRDINEEDPSEIEASKFDLAYIKLDGNIGCLVNGAGLAMATMDAIKLFGGEPANFLDVGGGASVEKVTEAFKIMLKNQKVKAILVNIFGGIMRCDIIAQGVIEACKSVQLNLPLVVRMKGTNEELGRQMLENSKLSIITANTMEEAATKIVNVSK
ncbi:MAG: ADP-forming succinate--CoA ligase subunit beta [Bordetella sp.]|nr:MAG: ADP-forming succinate--CoA ligase subunit beta [Bordetella sp.]